MRIALLFLFMNLVLNSSAQDAKPVFSVEVSAEAGIPAGIFHSVYGFIAGGNAGVCYTISKTSAFTGTAGFLQFFRKGGGEGVSFVPLLGGFRYHFIPEAFVSFEAGGAIPTYAGGGILACIVPAAGYQISRHFSADLNYTGFAQYGLLVGGMNVRLRYSF